MTSEEPRLNKKVKVAHPNLEWYVSLRPELDLQQAWVATKR